MSRYTPRDYVKSTIDDLDVSATMTRTLIRILTPLGLSVEDSDMLEACANVLDDGIERLGKLLGR